MKRKLSVIMSMMLAGSMLLSACGSTQKEPQTIPTATEETTPEASEEPVVASENQEITFVLSNEPDGLDPGITNNSFAAPFLANCFEGLVTNDESGSVVPGNAETWDVSEDGTVYTFHLRDGLKWSDGSDLTAKDYVYSIERVLTPATTAQYLSMVTDYVAGAQEYYDGTGSEDTLGVKAVDDKTLQITLIQPTSFFIDILSMWVFDPVQKATIDANADKWTSSPDSYICNGPYKITEMNMGESIVLERNENYWDNANTTLDKITFRYIMDTSTALTAYEAGEVDGIRSVPSSDIKRLKASDEGLQTVSSFGTVYYLINCSKEPYNNPLVRKALNLAIDRQSIIDNVVQIDAQPAYNFISPGYAVDGEDLVDGRSDRGLSAGANPEEAKAALAEAGYPDGEGFPTLQLSYYSDDTAKKVVEAMAEMLETNLGIQVEISSNDWAIYYESVQKGDYGVAAMGWSADYMHPMSFLPLLVTGDVTNNSFYSNSQYDELVKQVMAETDSKKALDLMRQAENLVMDEYPYINLYYKANNFLMSKNVTGYYMTASGNLYFKHAKKSE
ncbi:MAG: oligopeptide transport system substrate-binding protein [Clostridiales bacterium]|nr:oligopeptide transport system substrate-binding protein [Clostridiales bacterium]